MKKALNYTPLGGPFALLLAFMVSKQRIIQWDEAQYQTFHSILLYKKEIRIYFFFVFLGPDDG